MSPLLAPERWPRYGWALFAACLFAGVVRALTASAPMPPRRLSPAERQAVGRAAAALELQWRQTSIKNFPDDHWSQDDDFSASERNWAVDEANRRAVPVYDVYQAIDEDLRADPPAPPRKSNASPCKPRPAYD